MELGRERAKEACGLAQRARAAARRGRGLGRRDRHGWLVKDKAEIDVLVGQRRMAWLRADPGPRERSVLLHGRRPVTTSVIRCGRTAAGRTRRSDTWRSGGHARGRCTGWHGGWVRHMLVVYRDSWTCRGRRLARGQTTSAMIAAAACP